MCEATKTRAAARGVCLKPGYGMAVGAFDPFAAAAAGEPWRTVATWQHSVEGGCEALVSLRFAVFSRLSSADVNEADALDEPTLRSDYASPSGGLLRAAVSVTRKQSHASKSFIVGAGGIDVFGSSMRVSLLAPPSMSSEGNAEYPLRPNGLGALEEVWVPIVGEDFASIRTRATVHTYCAADVAAPVPPSATRYTLLGPGAVTLTAGTYSFAAPSSGPVLGFRQITVDQNAVVAWEVEP